MFPAPAGSYITTKGNPSPDACKGSDPSPTTGQVLYNADAPCSNPYTQECNQGTLTADIMAQPEGIVKGMHGPYQYTNPAGRVGGCFTSRDTYGPGKFSVLVNLPPAAIPTAADPLVQPDLAPVDAYTGQYPVPAESANAAFGGRGYVFALWTFSYAESYVPPAADAVRNMQQPKASGEAPGATVPTETASGPGAGTLGVSQVAFPSVTGLLSGSANDGWYAEHNHEIDIEIPANTGQSADPLRQLSFNTANFNTWLTDQDVDTYAAGTQTMYQQSQVTAPDGAFFASVGPGETDEDYHEFSYVWYVDPDDEALPPSPTTTPASYVAFYRDGEELFRSHRYIPRRSGRVVVGLWPAWWGSQRLPLTYNHVYAKIARLEFVPQADSNNAPFPRGALVTNAPQTYDQVFPVPAGGGDLASGISCGYAAIPDPTPQPFPGAPGPGPSPRPRPGPGSAPGPGPGPPGAHGLPPWAIALIVIAGAVVVVAVVCGAYFGTKASRERKVPFRGTAITSAGAAAAV